MIIHAPRPFIHADDFSLPSSTCDRIPSRMIQSSHVKTLFFFENSACFGCIFTMSQCWSPEFNPRFITDLRLRLNGWRNSTAGKWPSLSLRAKWNTGATKGAPRRSSNSWIDSWHWPNGEFLYPSLDSLDRYSSVFEALGFIILVF